MLAIYHIYVVCISNVSYVSYLGYPCCFLLLLLFCAQLLQYSGFILLITKSLFIIYNKDIQLNRQERFCGGLRVSQAPQPTDPSLPRTHTHFLVHSQWTFNKTPMVRIHTHTHTHSHALKETLTHIHLSEIYAQLTLCY